MKNKVLAVLLVCLLIVAMVSCQGEGNSQKINSEEDIAEQYIFTFDGREYQLPCNVTELTSAGWSYKENYLDRTLEGETFVDMDFSKDGKSLRVSVTNFDEESKNIDDCKITAITVNEDTETSFSTNEKIGLGSTLDDVKEKYGEYEEGYYEDEERIKYSFFEIYRYENTGKEAEFKIEILEKSLDSDAMQFKVNDGDDKIREISLEYYPEV